MADMIKHKPIQDDGLMNYDGKTMVDHNGRHWWFVGN